MFTLNCASVDYFRISVPWCCCVNSEQMSKIKWSSSPGWKSQISPQNVRLEEGRVTFWKIVWNVLNQTHSPYMKDIFILHSKEIVQMETFPPLPTTERVNADLSIDGFVSCCLRSHDSGVRSHCFCLLPLVKPPWITVALCQPYWMNWVTPDAQLLVWDSQSRSRSVRTSSSEDLDTFHTPQWHSVLG